MSRKIRPLWVVVVHAGGRSPWRPIPRTTAASYRRCVDLAIGDWISGGFENWSKEGIEARTHARKFWRELRRNGAVKVARYEGRSAT